MTSSPSDKLYKWRCLLAGFSLLVLSACAGEPADLTIDLRQIHTYPPAAAGTMDPSHGGLPSTAWTGTKRDKAVTLINEIPESIASPALRDLARTVLLSAAWPPAYSGKDDPGLLAPRIRKLTNMGFLDDAAALYLAIPDPPAAPGLVHAGLNALFLAGRIDEACLDIMITPDRFAKGFWVRARALCQLYTGETAAGVASRNAAAVFPDTPRAFNAVATWLETRKSSDLPRAEVIRSNGLDEMTLGVLLLTGQQIVVDAMPEDGDKLSPGMLSAIANSEKISPLRRLKASYLAAQHGSVTTETLSNIYEKNKYQLDLPASPPAAEDYSDSAEDIAAIYLKAKKLSSTKSRLPYIRYGLYSQKSLLLPTARIYNNLLTPCSNSDLHSTPKCFVWSVLFKGGLDIAFEWNDFYGSHKLAARDESPDVDDDKGADKNKEHAERQGGEREPDQTDLFVNLYKPLGVIAQGALPTRQDLDKFLDSAHAKQIAPDKIARILAVVSAMGVEIEEGLRQKADRHSTKKGNDMSLSKDKKVLVRAMDKAAADERVAETVLLSLAALGKTGPDKADTKLVETAIKDLRSIGLENKARAIAVEVMATAID